MRKIAEPTPSPKSSSATTPTAAAALNNVVKLYEFEEEEEHEGCEGRTLEENERKSDIANDEPEKREVVVMTEEKDPDEEF